MHAARTLGYAGLIPFLGLAALSVGGPADWRDVSEILLAQYGGLILAFVGALHWGYAVQSGADGNEAWLRYGYSVLPTLWAWFVLELPIAHALQLIAIGLVICLIVDYAFHRRWPLPDWLLQLRAELTFCGVVSLLVVSLR